MAVMVYVTDEELETMAKAVVGVVAEGYFETMSAEERDGLKAAIKQELRKAVESMRGVYLGETGQEPGISY